MATKTKKVTPANDKTAETQQATSTALPFWLPSSAGLWEDKSYTNPYDKGYLGGLEIPGIVDVQTSISNAIDVQKTKGKSGSTIKFNGAELGKVKITATIWMPRHVQMYQQLLKLVQPDVAKKGLSPTVVPFQHPITTAIGILKVIVKEVGGIQLQADGTSKFTIDLLQYEPPKATKSTAAKPPTFQGSTFERTSGQQTEAEKRATGTNDPSRSFQNK